MSTSSQCIVPGDEWDVDNHNPAQTTVLSRRTHSISANSLPIDVPSLDYEVAELTWENGQLAMHGLAGPRVGTTKLTAWDKPLAGDTLESLVNQATSCHIPPAVAAEQLNELWADHHRNIAIDNAAAAAAAAVTMDRLVPCNTVAAANNNNSNTRSKNAENKENPGLVLGQAPAGTGTGTGTCGGGCSTKVGSCSGGASVAARGGRAPRRGPWQCGDRSESATFGTGTESLQMTLTDDTTYSAKGFFGGGFSTSTSLWSPENTSSGGDTKTSADDYTKISADDHDSVCITQKASGDRKRKASGKSSVSPRARAAANHNQSERKRRDRINQRMKILQKMVPNSSKTDKASMLDEVINYFKHLQAQVNVQVHVMRMNVQVHMMRLAMQQQQQLQMSMMAAPTMGVGMGIMDPMGRAAAAGVPSIVPPPGGYVPVPPWNVQSVDRSRSPDLLSAYLACQPQQPMTIDAYSRLAALYHQQLQHQQPHAPGPKNN